MVNGHFSSINSVEMEVFSRSWGDSQEESRVAFYFVSSENVRTNVLNERTCGSFFFIRPSRVCVKKLCWSNCCFTHQTKLKQHPSSIALSPPATPVPSGVLG